MASVTANNIILFKKCYKKALTFRKDSFLFEGQEVLTKFAKYLIEYWDLNHKRKNEEKEF